jgi:hypothetical protein
VVANAGKRNATPIKKTGRPWQDAFVVALAKFGTVTHAAEAAGIDRPSAYRHRKENEAFARRWEEAIEAYGDMLVNEARKRAVARSDNLLMFLIKGERPEKYRENLKLTGPGKDGEFVVAVLGPNQSVSDLCLPPAGS